MVGLDLSAARKKNFDKLENVAIAKALHLKAAGATPVLSRFNYDTVPSLTSLNLCKKYCRIIAFLLLL